MVGMQKKDKLIIVLILIGITVFGIVQGVVIPQINKKKQEYASRQQQPATHDINSILKYKNKYMGNASNIINLFYNLPQISKDKMTFQLYPDQLALEINYQTSINKQKYLDSNSKKLRNIGNVRLYKTLIYNSTAAFALIENLNEIDYNFQNIKYRVMRSSMQKWYGKDMSKLLPDRIWKSKVQQKLNKYKYVQDCINNVVQIK